VLAVTAGVLLTSKLRPRTIDVAVTDMCVNDGILVTWTPSSDDAHVLRNLLSLWVQRGSVRMTRAVGAARSLSGYDAPSVTCAIVPQKAATTPSFRVEYNEIAVADFVNGVAACVGPSFSASPSSCSPSADERVRATVTTTIHVLSHVRLLPGFGAATAVEVRTVARKVRAGRLHSDSSLPVRRVLARRLSAPPRPAFVDDAAVQLLAMDMRGLLGADAAWLAATLRVAALDTVNVTFPDGIPRTVVGVAGGCGGNGAVGGVGVALAVRTAGQAFVMDVNATLDRADVDPARAVVQQVGNDDAVRCLWRCGRERLLTVCMCVCMCVHVCVRCS
jgi:hypothetical protein